MPTYNIDLSSVDQGEDIIQVITAPTDGYLLLQMNGSGLTDDVKIMIQHSVDGSNFDFLKDFRGNPIVFFLQGGSIPNPVRVETLEPFLAGHLRAIIKAKENEGTIDLITP
jgi:hypothetical protein